MKPPIALLLSLLFTAVCGLPASPGTDAIQVISFADDASTSVSPSAEVLAQLRVQAQGQYKCDVNIGVPGGLFTCQEPNFKGVCKWFAPPPDKRFPCYTFLDANRRPASFGPDAGGFCQFYATWNFEGEMVKWAPHKWALRCPGLADGTRGTHPNNPYWYNSIMCVSG